MQLRSLNLKPSTTLQQKSSNIMSKQSYDTELVNGVRRFVEREILGKAHVLEDTAVYPQALVNALAEMGLFGIAIPPEYGGIALDIPTYAKIMEELGFGWTTLNCFLNSHTSASSILAKHATTEQKEKYLTRMATGDLRVAIALTEPNGGSDLQSIHTKATAEPDGSYRLNGGKIFITNGDRAGTIIVLARTGVGKNGISLFLLDKGTEGFTVGARARTVGHRHIDVMELHFDNVLLPKKQLIGEIEGRGLNQMLDALETGRIAMAASAVGLSRSALKSALDYANQRISFGQPIAQHQAIQVYLAEMGAKIMAARALVMEAANIKNSGERADMIAGMAKLFASETCAEVTLNCVRIHGGSGFVSDFPAARYYHEAPYFILTEGSNEIQKLIIARRLINGEASSIEL